MQQLRCDKIVNNQIKKGELLSLTVKKIFKCEIVNIRHSYGQ